MADWVTISSLGTAGGTLVLAVATFASVRSANRTARVAELSLLTGLRPVLIPSREQDPTERIRFGDGQIVHVPGHGAAAEEHDGVIFLALALRNGGSGLAVIHGWRARRQPPRTSPLTNETQQGPAGDMPALDEFRRQNIDLYIPAGDNGYWLGAMRDPEEAGHEEVSRALRDGDPVLLDLLYSDHEGGQRTVARLVLAPWPEEEDDDVPAGSRRTTVLRYWNLDRAGPRG